MHPKIKKPVQKIQKYNQYRWFRWLWRSTAIIMLLIFVSYVGMAWYVNNNKPAILKSLTETLNEGLRGTLIIEDMEPAFLTGFPQVSLRLKNVIIRDSLYERHKRTLLHAEDFDIAVNALALFRGAVQIRKVTIRNAKIDLYTDSLGYSNTAVFKESKSTGGSGDAYPELKKFGLENVRFTIDNTYKKKLFKFDVKDLKGGIKYDDDSWQADLKMETLVNSMAFSTNKGSFSKNKIVEGELSITYDQLTTIVNITPSELQIGDEDFVVSAAFGSVDNPHEFKIRIENDRIQWRKASELLSPNISSRLELFNLDEPIAVACDIIGDFSVEGDPLISVKAVIRDNVLHTAGGKIKDCNFDGYFTNNFKPELGFNDVNSTITFKNFIGNFSGIPLKINEMHIHDLENPIATGDLESNFEVKNLNNIIDSNLLRFANGNAKVKINFTADIVNYELAKPLVDGRIDIAGADISYMPRKLDFKDVAVALNFKDGNLEIGNIHLETGKSVVNMSGRIDNFLNLYYSDPEKIILKWNVNSPQLHLGEFIGFLGSRKNAPIITKKKGDFTGELDVLFDKSNVDMDVVVQKLYYNKFYGTDMTATIKLTQSGINVTNGKLLNAGGRLAFSGAMVPAGNTNNFNINATVSNVNIGKFFESFNNFQLESLQSQNLKGQLKSTANLSGKISDSGALVENSLRGTVDFGLHKGALINFDPIKNVGKYAFPFRDFNQIDFYDLNGKFDIRGEKVKIYPMKVNSSVINMDVEGIYSFGAGTEIYVSVPLRDPKRDENITDEAELAKRRKRGIVVNVVAKDGDDGKIKIGLGKKDN